MKKLNKTTPMLLLLLSLLVSCGPESRRLQDIDERITGYEGSSLIDNQVEYCGVLYQSAEGHPTLVYRMDSMYLEAGNNVMQGFLNSFNSNTSMSACVYGKSVPRASAVGLALEITGLISNEGHSYRYCGEIQSNGSSRILRHSEGEYLLSANNAAIVSILNNVDQEIGCVYSAVQAVGNSITVTGIMLN